MSGEIDENSFILANLDLAGFYRVNYDEENWNKIIKQLDTNKEVRFFIILRNIKNNSLIYFNIF